MKSIELLCLSKEPWESPRRARKHLLFEALVRQSPVNEVLYVNPHRHFWQKRLKAVSAPLGLRVWQGAFLLPGERFCWVRLINRVYVYQSLKKRLAHRTFWYTMFYNPWDVPLARRLLMNGNVFFDWTDDWAIYYNDLVIGSAQESAIKMASGVIAVTESLRDRAGKLRGDDQRVLLLPNATAWRPVQTIPPPEDMQKIPYPRLGFLGTGGPWFDTELVVSLCDSRPGWNWVIVGNVNKSIKDRFRTYPNIHLLGQKSFTILQSYMAQCQILVAPYRQNFQGDSTKLYDYLTLGLPIISTDIETAHRLKPHVRIASDREVWIKAIEKALEENSDHSKLARQEESLKHTWDARATVLMDWLSGFRIVKR